MMRRQLKNRLEAAATSLSQRTDSSVVHLKTLRRAIGFVAVALPITLVVGENVRDLMLGPVANVGRVAIETSISAYFHTGMREVFVGSLCAVAMFLICYRGPQRWDALAANIAGFSLLLVAVFPTPERSREATDTGELIDSVTLFSTERLADPAFVGYVHFGAAAIFFTTLALMSLFLFTKTDQMELTPEKRSRNRVYVACGVIILACVVLIAIGKLFLSDQFAYETRLVFCLETVAVMAFGFSWLTKAEVVFADDGKKVAWQR